MQKTVVQVLEEVEGLLSDRKRWTQCALARDAKGMQVSAESPTACQWCLYGAMRRVTDDELLRFKVAEIFGNAAHRTV